MAITLIRSTHGTSVLSWPMPPDGKQHYGYINGNWAPSTTATWECDAWVESAGAHTHTVTAKGTVTSTFSGNEVTTTSVGKGQAHTHTIGYTATSTNSTGVHTHKLTTEANITGGTGNGESVNIQNPYITVYMWSIIICSNSVLL